MKIEMGESLFYSWLRHVKECQIVQTNWKTSTKWPLRNEKKLEKIKKESDELFKKKYKYQIYKKTKSLSQLLQQAECDVLGISIDDKGNSEVCAIDVAFHESGLNYNGKEKTIPKVINKSLRTAMCIIGYLNKTSGTIIFASPKINKNIMDKLEPCIEELQKFMNKLGYKFKFELIANEDFQDLILEPMLKASDKVADTSELFLRSCQMLKMFKATSNENKSDNNTSIDLRNYKDLKIGKFAQILIKEVIENKSISKEEVNNLTDKKYSKKVFNLNLPVLVKANSKYDKSRYYNEPIIFGGKKYLLCNMWFENNRPRLEKWVNGVMAIS